MQNLMILRLSLPGLVRQVIYSFSRYRAIDEVELEQGGTVLDRLTGQINEDLYSVQEVRSNSGAPQHYFS
jgi:hypothetical protein